MKNLKNLNPKYSLNVEEDNLIINGDHFHYSNTQLILCGGQTTIPIKDITNVSEFKYRDIASRNLLIFISIFYVLFDKIFGGLLFTILGLDIVTNTEYLILVIWLICLLRYFKLNKNLFEITTIKDRFFINKNGTTLTELRDMI